MRRLGVAQEPPQPVDPLRAPSSRRCSLRRPRAAPSAERDVRGTRPASSRRRQQQLHVRRPQVLLGSCLGADPARATGTEPLRINFASSTQSPTPSKRHPPRTASATAARLRAEWRVKVGWKVGDAGRQSIAYAGPATVSLASALEPAVRRSTPREAVDLEVDEPGRKAIRHARWPRRASPTWRVTTPPSVLRIDPGRSPFGGPRQSPTSAAFFRRPSLIAIASRIAPPGGAQAVAGLVGTDPGREHHQAASSCQPAASSAARPASSLQPVAVTQTLTRGRGTWCSTPAYRPSGRRPSARAAPSGRSRTR